MSGYQAYPEYRDSGVEWIGKVPNDWLILKIKHLLKTEKGSIKTGPFGSHLKGDDMEGGAYKVINQRSVIDNDFVSGSFYVSREKFEKLASFKVFSDDILITTRGTIGRTAIAPTDIVESILHPCLMRLQIDQGRFSNYLTSLIIQESGYFLEQLKILSNATTIEVIYSETLKNVEISLAPDIEEQQKIANFLDHETAKIDTLIEKQQRLIKLLKEKRQAVISHAVTKGLNPDAPMKDSGVEWLGEVPAHWTVSRAKFVSKVFVPQRNKPTLNDVSGTPWVTMEDMKQSHINSTNYFVSIISAQEAGSKKLPRGAVLASCVGNFGDACINTTDVIINQQIQAYVPHSIEAEYLRNLVGLSAVYFELVGTAATLLYVNQEGFAELPVTVPPLAEQSDISHELALQGLKYDNLMKKCNYAIHTLKERRTALISAAVTGKIDVRNWQPPKPTSTTSKDA